MCTPQQSMQSVFSSALALVATLHIAASGVHVCCSSYGFALLQRAYLPYVYNRGQVHGSIHVPSAIARSQKGGVSPKEARRFCSTQGL